MKLLDGLIAVLDEENKKNKALREAKKKALSDDLFYHLTKTKGPPSFVRLMDTPRAFGEPLNEEIKYTAVERQKDFERVMHEIIHGTNHICDISSLNAPDSDWAKVILGAMDVALQQKDGKDPILFRFLFGQTPLVPIGEDPRYQDFKYMLLRMCRERKSKWKVMPEIWFCRNYRLASGIGNSLLSNFLGSYANPLLEATIGSSGTTMTWNHTKIIAADGAEALVGGHNLNMDLFKSYPPVFDTSVAVHGEAAEGPHLYLDKLWACGSDLISKEKLNLDKSPMEWESKTDSSPTNPLTKEGSAKAYMKEKWTLLSGMHGKKDDKSPKATKLEASPKKDLAYLNAQTTMPLPDLFPDLKLEGYGGMEEYISATRIMTVGKYWNGPDYTENFMKASEIMKKYLIMNAKKTIKFSQQDIVSAWKKNWRDHHVCRWILNALDKNAELNVYVVVSPLNAGAGAEGDQYSFGSGAKRTYQVMEYYMTHNENDELKSDEDVERAKAVLQRLHIAPFFFTDLPQEMVEARNDGTQDANVIKYEWPDLSKEGYTATLSFLAAVKPQNGQIGKSLQAVKAGSGMFKKNKVPSAPGNHSKLTIFDDELYLCGSDNMYPGNLSEINYVLEGPCVKTFLDEYWNKLWNYSQPHTIEYNEIEYNASNQAQSWSIDINKKKTRSGAGAATTIKRSITTSNRVNNQEEEQKIYWDSRYLQAKWDNRNKSRDRTIYIDDENEGKDIDNVSYEC